MYSGAENGYIGYKIYRTKCLPSDCYGLGNTRNLSYYPIVGQLFMQIFRQCCVQQSNGWTVLCPIVQWSDNALSNCPMVGQYFVRQSYVAKFCAFCRTVWDKNLIIVYSFKFSALLHMQHVIICDNTTYHNFYALFWPW